MPPSRKRPRKWPSQGQSRRWGEVPHRRLGMAAWTHLANEEETKPSSAWTRRREVKQGKSWGSVEPQPIQEKWQWMGWRRGCWTNNQVQK